MNTRPLLLLVALALLGPLATASAQAPLKRPLLNACAGDQSNVPYWTNALKAPDPQLRARAAQNLGEARARAAVDEVGHQQTHRVRAHVDGGTPPPAGSDGGAGAGTAPERGPPG